MSSNFLFLTEAIHADQAAFFQGRMEIVETAIKTLKKKTQTCIIFGERGVGKTSLVWQILSILDGSNPRFGELYKKHHLHKKKFLSVVVKEMSAPLDANDLLMQCIAPSRDARSLFVQVPKLYHDGEFLGYVNRTYGVDLLSVRDLLLLSKTTEEDEVVRRLFRDVMEECHKHKPKHQIVFFVDEVDLMGCRRGLGQIIKNTDFAKFVFVGIADTLEEIVTDHLSAARKVIGGVLEVPPLSGREIRAIFYRASNASNQKIAFSRTFLDQAVKYSAGFPWIAQHLGDQATSDVDMENVENGRGPKYSFDSARFSEIWPIVRTEYGRISKILIDWPQFEEERMLRRVATIMAENPGKYPRIDDIDRVMTDVDFPTVDAAVTRLINLGILHSRPGDRVRFSDPIVRSFCIEAIERIEKTKIVTRC